MSLPIRMIRNSMIATVTFTLNVNIYWRRKNAQASTKRRRAGSSFAEAIPAPQFSLLHPPPQTLNIHYYITSPNPKPENLNSANERFRILRAAF